MAREAKDEALTTEGLRHVLFKAIDDLSNDKITCVQAQNIAKLSDQIIKSAHLEIEYSDHLQRLDFSETKVKAGPMRLTSAESAASLPDLNID